MKKPTTITITPSEMGSLGKWFIRSTFCRVASEKYKLDFPQSETAFEKCLDAGCLTVAGETNGAIYYIVNPGSVTI